MLNIDDVNRSDGEIDHDFATHTISNNQSFSVVKFEAFTFEMIPKIYVS